MKIIFALLGLLLLIVIAFTFSQNFFKNSLSLFGTKPTVTINKAIFTLDIAKTPTQKQIGLSEKTSISSTYGMLFPFEKPDSYAFWMRDMKFPIDIIFIRDNKIVTIYDNVPVPADPNSTNLPLYQPEEPADKVLEIQAGTAKKYNFKKGDQVTFQNLPK